MSVLSRVHGELLVVRPPVPATVNKAGANYKSEVAHLSYSPRRAFDEWLAICDAIVACGGDALFAFEPEDDCFLDAGELAVADDGSIHPAGSSERLGHLDDVSTGRVFTANGPWVTVDHRTLRAVMPNMLAHRRREATYYRDLLATMAELGGYELEIADNPHRWEGMADVAAVGDKVVLTCAVPGHYDEGIAPKSPRSSHEGVAFAAEFAGVPESSQIHAELVYPHFHGDTVHFGARPPAGDPVLVHYPGGLWGDGAEALRHALAPTRIIPIGKADAVDAYAGNSRQVRTGVLVPDGVSREFLESIRQLGLSSHPVALFELFGKAGGGPACATLYMPTNLQLPARAPLRYSQRRAETLARRDRLPERLMVDPGFFADKPRG